MSDSQLPSDVLFTLRQECQHADCVTVDKPVLLALLDCIAAASRYRNATDLNPNLRDWNEEQSAFDLLDTRLEALGLPAP